jgi:hypothetical protein
MIDSIPTSSSPSRKESSAWLVRHTTRMGPTRGLNPGSAHAVSTGVGMGVEGRLEKWHSHEKCLQTYTKGYSLLGTLLTMLPTCVGKQDPHQLDGKERLPCT